MIKTFTKFSSVLIALAMPFWANTLCAQFARPNILFIIADDWGKHAAAYGHENWINFPAFDRVAKEGVLFENCYSASPASSACRASILAGVAPWRNKEAIQDCGVWPFGENSFPLLLARAGYHVGMTGKGWSGGWKAAGLKTNPAGKAYDKFVAQNLPSSGFGTWDYSKNFIEDFMAARPSKGTPFMFWIGFDEPSRPYEEGSAFRAGKPVKNSAVPKNLPTEKVVKSDLADYAMEIEYMNSHIEKILKYLEEIGELHKTVIIITSDCGAPFPGIAGTLVNDAVNVPLAVRWGVNIPKKRTEKTFVSSKDFAPTILAIAGVDKPKSMEGKSFAKLLTAEEPEAPSEGQIALFARERIELGRPKNAGYPSRGMREANYIIIHNFRPDLWPLGSPETAFADCPTSPTKSFMLSRFDDYFALNFGKRPEWELYDIEKDPHCISNLADSPDKAEIFAKLKDRMAKEFTASGDFRSGAYNASALDKIPYYGNRKTSYEDFLKSGQRTPAAKRIAPSEE